MKRLAPITLVTWTGYALAAAAAWLAFNYSNLRHYFQVRQLRNENRAAVAQLDARRGDLIEEKQQLETLGFSAEEALRERFKMKLEGEHVIELQPPDAPDSALPAPQEIDSRD